MKKYATLFSILALVLVVMSLQAQESDDVEAQNIDIHPLQWTAEKFPRKVEEVEEKIK